MKLKLNPNGTVDFIMIAGKDYVRHTMTEAQALEIIEENQDNLNTNSKIHEGFSLSVADGKMFFPIIQERKPRTKKSK